MAPPQVDSYRSGHPATASLVIEVSQTSRRRDLGLKAALYAAAGVPDYWVVDVARSAVIVHRDPRPSGFGSVSAHVDGVVRPLHHPGASVDVRQLLA